MIEYSSQINKFTPPHKLNTAVLFLVFNRLEKTKQVFEAIREAKPPRLYIAADGAREDKVGEEEKVLAVREYITQNINWDCEVKTLFRDKNLKSPDACSSAISWFFENEEMGIIFEDDCLPVKSFFWFCEELLEKYKDNHRIGMISGTNLKNGEKIGDADYFFSIYGHMWGWASWSNRWKNFDMDFQSHNSSDYIENIFTDKRTVKYWKNIFNSTRNWDYSWLFILWKNDQLSIYPNINLVSNIGMGADATHPSDENHEFSNLKRFELKISNHPLEIKRNYDADYYESKKVYNTRSILARIVNKICRILLGKNLIK